MTLRKVKSLACILVTGMFAGCFSVGATAQQTTNPTSEPAAFVLSPYKYVKNEMAWNHQQLTTSVTGKPTSFLAVIPPRLNTVTLAFATGECGKETWEGLSGQDFADANIGKLVSAGKKYIISTGGQAGNFTCASDVGFRQFIERYQTTHLLGFDFDIEADQSVEQIDQLMLRIHAAQIAYPNLRFSFTLPTLAIVDKSALGTIGVTVMNAIHRAGLTHYYINLMVMDYGVSSSEACVVGADGKCDMGRSAIQAALNLHTFWNVPFAQIELTPMIGGNDTEDETFDLNDVATISAFARQYKLAGIHYWSIDRDTDCAPGAASPTCNTYGTAGVLGFTNAFLQHLAH